MNSTRNVRHPAQSLISFWRPNCRQQSTAWINIRGVGKDDRRFRDRTVSLGHKCKHTAEQIDGEIGWVGLPASFDAHRLISETTVLQRHVRSQSA
jgi:hypothetical protein